MIFVNALSNTCNNLRHDALASASTWFKCVFFFKCFLFLHVLNGRMATLPQDLPRSFRDLHDCFHLLPQEQVQNNSFHEFPRNNFFSISLEMFPRSHREFPQFFFLGVAWRCVICICWWAGHSDNVFGCTGWKVKNTYYIKVIHPDFEFHRWQIHVTF